MSTGTPFSAAIFDMDGTIVDNTPYHFKAWQELFRRHNLPGLSKATYLNKISGVPIINTVRQFFGEGTSKEQAEALAAEKQLLYRQAYLTGIKEISGLVGFLKELKKAGKSIALATSSGSADIDFIFGKLPLKHFFDVLVTGNMVTEPKPSPQIFLKAANLLNKKPAECLVFEDSTAGLHAGKNAGMKVAGITTSHSPSEMAGLANMVFDNYTQLDMSRLNALFYDITT